jgi:hypothetical protein
MKSRMSFDDVVLAVQGALDRAIRRLRVGRAPRRDRRRLLIVQIDGLSRAVLEEALATGCAPFLRRLLERHRFRMAPMCVGLPTSTPAFQLSAMYGVRPDIPGFHFHDKRRREDVYFPRAGDAARVEREQAVGRRGIVEGGSTYGCVFTGGAHNNLFSMAMIKRPAGAGLLPLVSALVVMVYAFLKAAALTAMELVRGFLRFVADPFRGGWKLLAIKVAVSVWMRELFTLAVARDVYAGVPVVYVNFLDYDVFAHEAGPRHRRALRALRRIDRSIHQLWRICRRVPEYQYDLYVLSDHGQAHCRPFLAINSGKPLERHLFDEFFDPVGAAAVTPQRPRGRRRLTGGIKAYRSGRAPGLLQRFVNYLEDGFPWVLGELREARERAGVRVVAAGPNAFVYFVDRREPVALEEIDQRFPGVADGISRMRTVGIVLARSAAGPVCLWRGKRYALADLGAGPFAGRPDLGLVTDGIRDLMEMPSAGDLVIYGLGAPEGHVSYVAETGAHAGATPEEMHTFVVAPPGVVLPSPLTHAVQLYPHFAAYQEASRAA